MTVKHRYCKSLPYSQGPYTMDEHQGLVGPAALSAQWSHSDDSIFGGPDIYSSRTPLACWSPASVLDDFTINTSSFILAVITYWAATVIPGPFITKMAMQNASFLWAVPRL
ncbi:MAG: hypothetical protein R2839_07605 [Thermomicrobiales bacterium]